jgi:pyruvate dehydrogenase E2 component (dihydrolipoamide acetyltransferase)
MSFVSASVMKVSPAPAGLPTLPLTLRIFPAIGAVIVAPSTASSAFSSVVSAEMTRCCADRIWSDPAPCCAVPVPPPPVAPEPVPPPPVPLEPVPLEPVPPEPVPSLPVQVLAPPPVRLDAVVVG